MDTFLFVHAKMDALVLLIFITGKNGYNILANHEVQLMVCVILFYMEGKYSRNT